MTVLAIALGLLGLGVWLAHDGLAPRPAPPVAREPRRGLAPVQDWLAQADLPGVTVWHLAVLCVAGSLLGSLAGYIAFGVPVTAALGAVAGGLTAPAWVRTRRGRRRPARQRAIAQALERMRDTLSSGLTLDRAFHGLGDNGPREPAAVLPAVLRRAAAAHRFLRDRRGAAARPAGRSDMGPGDRGTAGP